MTLMLGAERWWLRLRGLLLQGSAIATTTDTNRSRVFKDLDAWDYVNAEIGAVMNIHQTFWWRHAGHPLAVLLAQSGYSQEMQHFHLKFFAQVVAPHLGVARHVEKKDAPWWPSFMTDDGSPVELSWDWGLGDKPPTIRYSFEPIGLNAGTSIDPANLVAGEMFHRHMLGYLPNTRLEWFEHFIDFFNQCPEEATRFCREGDDHKSSIFYALDLSPSGEVIPKAYFFPRMRALKHNQSNLEVIFQAIRAAPCFETYNSGVVTVLEDFSYDTRNKNLEYDMLAIDLVNPAKSRIKIYFRCRKTTFESVIDMMTLGGRLDNPDLRAGLQNLRELWNYVFERDPAEEDDKPLDTDNQHRTGGLLYNVEFKLGDSCPVAKLYIPVRHYARSDEAVMEGLNKFLCHCQRAKYFPKFHEAMNTVL